MPGSDEANLKVILAAIDRPEPSGLDRITACGQLGWIRAMVPPMVMGVLFRFSLGGGAAGNTITKEPGVWCYRYDLRYRIDLDVWRTSNRKRHDRPLEPKKVWMISSFSSVVGDWARGDEGVGWVEDDLPGAPLSSLDHIALDWFGISSVVLHGG